EAEEAFDKALTYRPNNARILFHLGHLYRIMEDKTRAREFFQKSLEMSQTDEALQNVVKEALESLDAP
ncbi:MAG: tetratricopeptide repeat protein, partial [Candidatus Latescibacterota bacterium]